MKGIIFSASMVRAWLAGNKSVTRRLMNPQPDKHFSGGVPFYPGNYEKEIKPPYRPGETVYIKETWAIIDPSRIIYKEGSPDYFKRHWRSALFMPEWATRSYGLIVSVRPERLQDITEEEARREGVTPFRNDPEGDCWTDGKYRTAFEYLWNELNGWMPNNFSLNPWVWRIEMEKKP